MAFKLENIEKKEPNKEFSIQKILETEINLFGSKLA